MAEQFAFERTEEFNARVREWALRLQAAARSTVAGGVRQNTRLGRSIKSELRKQDGQVFRVAVGFVKEGAYIHVGAGRGYGGFKGGKFYSTAKKHISAAQAAAAADPKSKKKAFYARAGGHMVDVNPMSIGKMGRGARRQFPWLNPQVEALLPELAAIAKEYMVDAWIKSKAITTNIVI